MIQQAVEGYHDEADCGERQSRRPWRAPASRSSHQDRSRRPPGYWRCHRRPDRDSVGHQGRSRGRRERSGSGVVTRRAIRRAMPPDPRRAEPEPARSWTRHRLSASLPPASPGSGAPRRPGRRSPAVEHICSSVLLGRPVAARPAWLRPPADSVHSPPRTCGDWSIPRSASRWMYHAACSPRSILGGGFAPPGLNRTAPSLAAWEGENAGG